MRAARILASRSLRLAHVDTLTSRGADGTIVRQSPDSGATAHPNDAVDVTVAISPPQVAVPSVVSFSRIAARDSLRAVGLDVGTIDFVTGKSSRSIVVGQLPAAGTLVDSGSTVNITENRPPILQRAKVPDLAGMTRV